MTRWSNAATADALTELAEHVDVEQFQLLGLLSVSQHFRQPRDGQWAVNSAQLREGLASFVAVANDRVPPHLQPLAPFLFFHRLPVLTRVQVHFLRQTPAPLVTHISLVLKPLVRPDPFAVHLAVSQSAPRVRLVGIQFQDLLQMELALRLQPGLATTLGHVQVPFNGVRDFRQQLFVALQCLRLDNHFGDQLRGQRDPPTAGQLDVITVRFRVIAIEPLTFHLAAVCEHEDLGAKHRGPAWSP